MDGVELASRFSYMPNKLGYCGPLSEKIFLDYIENKKNKAKIKESLKRFEGLYPYLQIIAKKNKKSPFDYDVVEAYWIGNSLLEKITKNDLKILIKKLTRRGLPVFIAKKLIENIPSGVNAQHSFNVFFVGVGMITGSVKTTLKNMCSCMISYGSVKKIEKNALLVSYIPIIRKKEAFVYGKKTEKRIKYDKRMIKTIKKNDVVAFHWDLAVKILSKKEQTNLKKYTTRNINSI
ncbi:MAG: hypothetical protein GY861_07030 [bacterium]|nr:hypothetical protein [bacterium]